MARAWRGRGRSASASFPLGNAALRHKQANNSNKLKQATQTGTACTKCCFSLGKRCVPGTQAGSEALILGPLILRPLILGPLFPGLTVRQWRGRGAGFVCSPWPGQAWYTLNSEILVEKIIGGGNFDGRELLVEKILVVRNHLVGFVDLRNLVVSNLHNSSN